MFDGLSLLGDEVWTNGLNIWPFTLSLQEYSDIRGDKDIVREWYETFPSPQLFVTLVNEYRITIHKSKGLQEDSCCAWPTWIPFGCEFEHIFFINCAESSSYFGHIR